MYQKEYFSDRPLRSKIKRAFIGILPRRFHCYCVGAPKTGTSSIAKVFRKYRSGHEVDPKVLTTFILDYIEKRVTVEEATKFLRNRDRLLNLELESAHPLVYVSNLLIKLFPDSKYIITIREPYSFLNSRLNYSLHEKDPHWKKFREFIFGSYHSQYHNLEKVIKKEGLYSIDAYVKSYAFHYKQALNLIPKHKKLVIKTNNINEELNRIAVFLNIPKSSLCPSHTNVNKKKKNILGELDESYVRSRIWHHCSSLIKTYFPETIDKYKKAKYE